MTDDLHQAIDTLFKGGTISSESMKTIGTLLLREQQGRSVQEIGIELNLQPQEVRALAIRARGWEVSRQIEQQKQGR